MVAKKPYEQRVSEAKALSVEDGDCWLYPNERMARYLRHKMLRASGKHIKGGCVVTVSCGYACCLNPEHAIVSSRTTVAQRSIADHGVTVLHAKRLAVAARKKLTPELVDAIRTASGTQREIAKQYGISQSMVSQLATGKTWRDYSNPFQQLMGR